MDVLNEFKVNSDIYLIRYLIVELVNISIFVYAGLKIKKLKDNIKYWNYAKLPIISYAICKGLRFGRDVDYNLYYNVFQSIGEDFWNGSNHEFLFKLINWSLYQLGFTYQYFILFCSIFLIYVAMKFIEEHKEIAPLFLLLFLLETTLATNYIRWYLSFSFFFLSYIYLNKKSYVLFITFFSFASLIHAGIIILYVLLILLYNYKKTFPPKIIFMLFLSSLFLGEIKQMSFLIPYADFIFSLSERTQGYAIRFEDLINGDWITGVSEMSIISKLRSLFLYSFPIFYYPIIIRTNNKYNSLTYNLFCIGFILFPIFNTVELFDRYTRVLMFFSIIVSSVSIHHATNNRNRLNKSQKKLYIISIISLCYSIMSLYFHQLENQWFETLFIWDADRLNQLPIWYFQQDFSY